MNDWKQVETTEDIDELLQTTHGFHDTCITSIRYVSGNRVDKKNSMIFANTNDYELHICFQGQWEPKNVELCFNGVRQLFLVGLEDNYLNDIYGAYLAFHDDLLPSKYRAPKRVIVWADDSDFDIHNMTGDLIEPAVTYVIANTLKWRILDHQ